MDKEIRKNLEAPASPGHGIKAAVIVPSVCDFYFTPHRFSCLGAQVVCKILTDCGIPNVFFNFPLIDKNQQYIDIPEDIMYLKDYFFWNESGKTSYFTKYQRFGQYSKECAKQIVEYSPSICFISCFAYSYANEAIGLARDIKTIKPEIPIVVGGAGVSAYPLYFIRDPNVDYAITGEAEISLKPFMKALLEKELKFKQVPNLFWKQDKKIKVPSKPRYTLNEEIMPVIAKVHEKKDSVFYSVSLTRGCDNKCRFCSNFLAHGKGFRIAPLDTVALMIDGILIDQKTHFLINFEDDNLLCAPEYLLKVMQLFREKFGDLAFLAENGIDYNLLTPSLADTLIDAGMSKFNFTLGSIAEKVLKSQARKGSQTHFESIVRHIALRGIPVLSYFICGLKGDTKESVAEVLTYLYSLPTQIGISMFYAIPGLPDFKDLTVFDKLKPHMSNGTSAHAWYHNGSLTTKDLITAFRISRYINLLKSSIKSDTDLRLIEKIQKEKKIFTIVKNKNKIDMVPAPGMDDDLVSLVLEKITP
jgi:anaerobic magnesium-protoporphyrin IX monomethyl ester cyclase